MDEPIFTPDALLSDLGEEEFLGEVFTLLGEPTPAVLLGPGDDSAVVAAPDGRYTVTNDMLVQDVDFRFDWSTGGDVGAKAAVQNLADVAAMGAVPTALVVAMAAPASTPARFALDLMRSLVGVCAEAGAVVVGGDLSAGPVVVVSVTAFGDLQERPPLTRSGARPGDVIAISGEPGWSGAGLDLLRADITDGEGALGTALARHRRPVLDVTAGPRAARAGATSMIDTSDGLLRDADRVARASGVRFTLDLGSPLLARQLRGVAPVAAALRADAATWVLSGGEDHGLLGTFPSAREAEEAGFEVIGSVSAPHPGQRPGVDVLGDDEPGHDEQGNDEQGSDGPGGAGSEAVRRMGFDHFRE